ncbi:MAG: hypothetical protein LC104_21370 [Bacteroidales bacterium]|nr:hypothetical protein [Bacteroidales bacterium]
MRYSRPAGLMVCLIVSVLLSAFGPAQTTLRERFRERLAPPAQQGEPVAETRLLMEGILKANFDGLGRVLQDKPTDTEGWNFARGQSLLIAEGANLLLMRPPTEARAREEWFARSADLRVAAISVAKAAAAKDYSECRASVADLANSCNRCHTAFRVPTRLVPFRE